MTDYPNIVQEAHRLLWEATSTSSENRFDRELIQEQIREGIAEKFGIESNPRVFMRAGRPAVELNLEAEIEYIDQLREKWGPLLTNNAALEGYHLFKVREPGEDRIAPIRFIHTEEHGQGYISLAFPELTLDEAMATLMTAAQYLVTHYDADLEALADTIINTPENRRAGLQLVQGGASEEE